LLNDFCSHLISAKASIQLSVYKTNICLERAITAAECLQSRRKLSLSQADAKAREIETERATKLTESMRAIIITTQTDICRFVAAHIAHT